MKGFFNAPALTVFNSLQFSAATKLLTTLNYTAVKFMVQSVTKHVIFASIIIGSLSLLSD